MARRADRIRWCPRKWFRRRAWAAIAEEISWRRRKYALGNDVGRHSSAGTDRGRDGIHAGGEEQRGVHALQLGDGTLATVCVGLP